MGLQSFKTFQNLLRDNHQPAMMKFKTKAGEINIFSNRMRLARAFKGLDLEDYTEKTKLGYEGFFKVFLTYSALESFMRICYGKVDPNILSDRLLLYNPDKVIKQVFEFDKKGLFIDFLSKLVNEKLQRKLTDLRDLRSQNITYLAAAIRHIFAHGHLTANANKMNPKNTHKICNLLSDFLLEFMDAEFTHKIQEYCQKKGL